MSGRRVHGRGLLYLAGSGTAVVLLVLGLLLVSFITSAAQVNVEGETAAAASTTAVATREDLNSDIELARTISREDGLADVLQNRAGPAGQALLTSINIGLLSANPRVTAFYFFQRDTSYILGQSSDPITHSPALEEQPPNWYGADNRMRATLQAVLASRGSITRLMLNFGAIGEPYGTVHIFQSIVAADGTTVVGALVEQVSGSSIFAPYLRAGGSNGNLFVIGNLVVGPTSMEQQARGRLPVTARDPSLDDSIVGGLTQTPLGFGLGGAHPRFTLHSMQVEGSSAAVGTLTINGAPLRVIDYASTATVSDSARRVLLLVAAFVTMLVFGVGGLVVYLNRRLDRGEREHAQRIELKNEELTLANSQLEVLAATDALTGLPNRSLLQQRIELVLSSAGRSKCQVALILLDLDGFKDINDTLGHHYGDLLLQQVGARLRETLRPADTVARLGGDEFAMLLPETSTGDAVVVAHRVLEALDAPFLIEEHALDIAASAGVAIYPEHGREASTLLRCADVAMYVAKRQHLGVAVYSAATDQHSLRRLALMSDLRQAILYDTLELHYQPKVALATGRIGGVEALLRWPHPEHGAILPEQFVPLAEHTGMIAPLTEWVLHTAIQQCRAWRHAGLSLDVAVNLSMRTLQDGRLPATIAALLREYGLSPEYLTLEITESALMADPARALDVVTRLSASGVRVAIDDFGTGYSSLGYLKRLPVHEIKIDKSFVVGLGTNSDTMDAAIVRSVIGMAQALDRAVVAEGVEHQASWESLQSLGCDLAQGYFLGRPMTVADLERWVEVSPWGLRAAPPEVGV